MSVWSKKRFVWGLPLIFAMLCAGVSVINGLYFKNLERAELSFLLGPNSEFTATTLDDASPAPGLVGCILNPSHSPEYLSAAFLVLSAFDGCTSWHSPSFLEY